MPIGAGNPGARPISLGPRRSPGIIKVLRRVANVSLAQGVAVPQELYALAPRKTVGLLIDPRQLAEIRTRRQTAWRMNQTTYNEPREVARELQWSRQVFAELHCVTLDVSDQAIEETAARIVDRLGLPEPVNQATGQELS